MSQSIKILIVEDDTATRFLTRRCLEKYNTQVVFDIKEAQNGMQGLQFVSTSAYIPDIILLDLQMPVMDGLEFLKVYAKLNFSQEPLVYILSTVIKDYKDSHIVTKNLVKGLFEKPLTEDHINIILSALSIHRIRKI